MRVLITGITGMIGSHLAKAYLEQGHELAGISRATAASRLMPGQTPWKHYAGDILDKKFLDRVWCDFRPELVFHLAAQAYNGQSWECEDTTYQTNVYGSHNVLSATLQHTPNAVVVPACSSAEYGIIPSTMHPIIEDTPLRPVTPYGVSKAAMEMMANQFAQNYGLRVVLPRLFIHVGPNHPPATALQAFAMQIAAIRLGKQSPIIKVGNLGSSRDFVDVRDGVRALQLIADEKFSGQTFNICTGRAWGIAQCLEMMIDIAKVEVEVVEDLGRMRPSDEALLVGNPERINALGWNAAIPFQKTLEDIFDNWVYRLQ